MNIEVFSYNENKTFGYTVQLDNFLITKMNKNIEFRNDKTKSRAFIDEKYKILNQLSAEFLKGLHGELLNVDYKNKKESKGLFLLFIVELDEFFKNEYLNKIFSDYNDTNNNLLDELDECTTENRGAVQMKIDLNNKIFNEYLSPILADKVANIKPVKI
jgi:hypothetical protein